MEKSRFNARLFFSIICVILVFSFGIVFADTNDTSTGLSNSQVNNGVSNGYTCLTNDINNKTSLSLQEAIFGTLALGSKQSLQNEISSEKSTSDSCWPAGGCTVKETAQVLLAQNSAGISTDDIQRWVISRNATSNDLNWFLEVDISNHIASQCTLSYDNSDKKINIQDDMTIKGNPGNCFSIAQGGYWLMFKDSCYDKEIKISCNQDFISALVYQKKTGTTVYVLPDTHSAAALGSTSEKVNVKCFKSGSNCDYEGSLWAVLALNKAGKNVDAFTPYLIAMAENNQKYFPSAFLYALTGADDQYSDIIQNQKQGRSWNIIGSPYSGFYDTSLAMLALAKSSADELSAAKDYLINIQGKDGCWNNDNIRDTAFLLYSGWPRTPGGGGGTVATLCEAITSQSCENSVSCLDAGGKVLPNFQCSGFNVCCSVKVTQASCVSQNGITCTASQDCNGNVVQSAEGSCCVGACIAKPSENTCQLAGDTCRDTCLSGEETDSTKACSTGVCCIASAAPASGGSHTWLIILLIILIILVVLGILYRSKLKIWWFKFRGKAKVSPVTRPGVPPISVQGYRPLPVNRPSAGYSRQAAPSRPPVRRPLSEKDNEMEETLKKLREMSK